jgi:hypothetical protein
MGAIALASASLISASVIGVIATAARPREASAATAGSTIKPGTMAVKPSKMFLGMGSGKGRPCGLSILSIQKFVGHFQAVRTATWGCSPQSLPFARSIEDLMGVARLAQAAAGPSRMRSQSP